MSSSVNETSKGTNGCKNTLFEPLRVKIGQMVADIWQFINLSRWLPSAMLDI